MVANISPCSCASYFLRLVQIEVLLTSPALFLAEVELEAISYQSLMKCNISIGELIATHGFHSGDLSDPQAITIEAKLLPFEQYSRLYERPYEPGQIYQYTQCYA